MSTSEQTSLSNLRAFRLSAGTDNATLASATRLASHLFETPISVITLLEDDTQWLLARTGLEACSTTREESICAYSVDGPARDLLVIPDTLNDDRFRDHPAVVDGLKVRFYVGAVMTTSDGVNLGSLCVIDTEPRPRPRDEMLARLRDLADLAVAELERVRAEKLIQRKEDMLAMAERMSAVGHWTMDLSDMRPVWSDEVYAVHGVNRADFDPAYNDALAFYPEADRKVLQGAIERAIEGEGAWELELEFRRADGTPRRVMTKGACEFDGDQAVSMFGIFQDVTEQRAAIDVAEEAARVKSDFLANMSHELRTPLSSIIGFTDLAIAQPDLPTKPRDYLRRVQNAGRGLLCLVNDILDFSKLEAGQVAIKAKPSDAVAVVRDVAELFAPQLGSKDLSLTLQHGLLPIVEVDPDRLRQVLINLVGNAVKFTETGGVTVDVAWRDKDQKLVVGVSDTGPGIPTDRLGELFLRFSQIDGSSTRNHGGTGLGLAICKGLAEAMGGRIGVESEVGKGSRFWVEVDAPRAEGQGDQAEQNHSELGLSGLSVLVADDNPANRELARLFLSGMGATVTLAEDGLDAIAIGRDQWFDIVLMDVRMPRMSGKEAMVQMRGLPRPPGVILAYTADGGDFIGDSTLLADGFDGVAPKPISAAGMTEAIAQARRSRADVRSSATG